MTVRNMILALIIVPILVASAFYLRALVRRTFFENRPKPENEMRAQLSQEALQSESVTRQELTLYFPDFETGSLVKESRELALASNRADQIRQIVLALIQGSQQGHERSLPSAAALRAAFLTADGTAYLDFSSDVTKDFPVGIESETLALYSVVDSIAANMPQVKQVKFLVQGQEVDTLDGHADLTRFYAPNLTTPAAPVTAAAP